MRKTSAGFDRTTTYALWFAVGTLALSNTFLFVGLTFRSGVDATQFLDIFARTAGPLGAATVAWLGVNHTVTHSRRLEVLKEWHADLRWACELSCSVEPQRVELGVALLDSLDEHPQLGEEEQHLIDAALEALTNALAFDES